MNPLSNGRLLLVAGVALASLAACGPVGGASGSADTPDSGAGTTLRPRLPTGVHLDPAGHSTDVGPLPLAMVAAPRGGQIVLLLNGFREQGVQVVDRASGEVVQTLPQAAAFLGLAFSPDGSTLYASGGNQDVVYRYDWTAAGRAALRDSLVIERKAAGRAGRRYPAGLALSRNGATLYVAENLTDSLAVVDLASRRVVQRLATGQYPYGVVVAPDGSVFVSAWGGTAVSVFTPRPNGTLGMGAEIPAGRHPSALLLNADGSRLFFASGSTDRVTVIDTRARRPVRELLDPPPSGPGEGSTPNALALSPDGTRLFVAEADANAVAVFDLSAATSGVAGAHGDDRLAGRIPVGWYPTAILARGDSLLVVNGKGRGSAPNPDGPQPILSREHQGSGGNSTLRQLSGTLTVLPADVAGPGLAILTARVAHANGWDMPARTTPSYPPFEHVIYIIKENRTFDQVLGDLSQADGDTSLLFFPRAVSPNHHALAERFGIFDRFFVNAEVSADGHNWTTAAYASDYVEKTVESNYSGRGRSYDYEGTNRGEVPDDDVNEPASGYLWDLAERKGITFRNFGEFVVPENEKDADDLPAGYRGDKPYLAKNTNPRFPGFDLAIPDQKRADIWLQEFRQYEAAGSMPALQIVRLPNDHTSGARAGMPTPRAAMADNDLALGRVIEALSGSRFWQSTVVFVLEDDAQNGPDHVDSHRSPLLVISGWNRPGVVHRFANTSDVLLTIEEILGLQSLSQFDHFGRPLREIWSDRADTRPYRLLTPAVPLGERNPSGTRAARASATLDLKIEDAADDDTFNRILWETIRGGNVPYPGPTRMSALEAKRGG